MGKRHRRKFTDEFKAETVKLTREVDLTETAAREWVKRAEASGSAKDRSASASRITGWNREVPSSDASMRTHAP